jgi:putative hemolysin
LRFQVFNPKLNKGLRTSYEQSLDVDDFDPYSEDLIVQDLKSKQVVGTHRLLFGSHAREYLYRFHFSMSKVSNAVG